MEYRLYYWYQLIEPQIHDFYRSKRACVQTLMSSVKYEIVLFSSIGADTAQASIEIHTNGGTDVFENAADAVRAFEALKHHHHDRSLTCRLSSCTMYVSTRHKLLITHFAGVFAAGVFVRIAYLACICWVEELVNGECAVRLCCHAIAEMGTAGPVGEEIASRAKTVADRTPLFMGRLAWKRASESPNPTFIWSTT